ncbi:MAG: AAA family ATPase [Nitrosomonas sp.]|nr:AAA family ATPase [Nitrosomonas sp.]
MRINKISSFGNVAVRNAEIDLRSPVALICGSNRAGKTSLRNGIVHALTGKTDAVSLKKDWPLLINKHDNNLIGYTLVNFDDDKTACINLHNGVHELKAPLHSALPYVLNPALFGSSTPDERRSFLFNLGNLRSDGAEVKEKLLARKCDAAKIEMIAPFLRSSFDNAEKHAQENVKQARANWKAITGETYGSLKAENWKATVPEVDEAKKRELEADLEFTEKELEQANQKLGAAQAEANGSKARNSEIVRLRETAEKVDRIRTKLDNDRQQVAMWTVKVEDTRRLAMGSKPGAVSCACPSCGTELIFDGKKLIERGGDLHGDEDSSVKLPEYENTLKMLRNAVVNGERDLAAAMAASEQLAMIESKDNAAVPAEDIDALNKRVAILKESRKQFTIDLEAINKNARLAADATEKTKKAARHHADVLTWDLIASSLAPDGIPSEMLGAALKPINARIAASVAALNFPGKVHIRDDVTIMEDDEKLYSLSSKATRLLIDSMIAEAISHVSGIRFFMVDEFDLLDLPSRSAYLGWLIDLAENKEIDTAIIFGTLKQPPTNLPPVISVHWLQDGVISGGHIKEVAA